MLFIKKIPLSTKEFYTFWNPVLAYRNAVAVNSYYKIIKFTFVIIHLLKIKLTKVADYTKKTFIIFDHEHFVFCTYYPPFLTQPLLIKVGLNNLAVNPMHAIAMYCKVVF